MPIAMRISVCLDNSRKWGHCTCGVNTNFVLFKLGVCYFFREPDDLDAFTRIERTQHRATRLAIRGLLVSKHVTALGRCRQLDRAAIILRPASLDETLLHQPIDC